MINVLCTDNISVGARAMLMANPEISLTFFNSKEALPPQLKATEAMLIRSQTRLDEEALSKALNLKFIVTATTGFDHIDLKYCGSKNIAVVHCPEPNAKSAAEHTILLTLNLLKKVALAEKNLRSKKWRDGLVLGENLSGKVWSIFGLGRVGQQVAKIAQSFGVKIVAYDPYQDDEVFKSVQAERLGLTEALAHAEIASLHMPLTKETKHMFSRTNLESLSTEAYLINTSRGAIINENDLYDVLSQNLLKGAALDVFEHEPLLPQSRLLSLPQVILTPHIGGLTKDAFEAVSTQAAQSLIDWINGQPQKYPLPPRTEWASFLI